MILLIDNYDSFTYNLVHYFGELGAPVDVVRNDEVTVRDALRADAIVISPGPGTPDDAGICLDIVRDAGADLPIFGVCLGHQTIGQAFGGVVKRAKDVMHGKLSPIRHGNRSVFKDAPQDMQATRYHSLIVDRDTLPDCLEVTAETSDGAIMGLAHKDRPVHGVQFHPESIRTEAGKHLLANFLDIAGVKREALV